MNGEALKTIYQNIFTPALGEPRDARVRRFQQLAAASLKSPEGMRDFKAYLAELNNGVDPQLREDQLAAFFWMMASDQNCNTVKPWGENGVELW